MSALWFICSAAASILVTAIWLIDKFRTAAQRSLILPDGSPTVDEYVTRPMLAMSQTCAQLSRRIYARLEDLPRGMVAGLHGLQFDQVLTSPGHDAVCALVYYSDAVIVVWRGTNLTNRKQVRANRSSNLMPFDARCSGKVHSGLHEMFSGLRFDLMRALDRHAAAGRKIYVTGHSQGGGLAALTVAALQLRSREPSWSISGAMYMPAGLITFGAMRPGDPAFAKLVSDSLSYDPVTGLFGIQRYRNNNDIVPLVPPLSMGYKHSGRELYIWPAGMVTVNPCTALKFLQHLKPIAEGVIGDGLKDHSMAEYERHILNLRIGS